MRHLDEPIYWLPLKDAAGNLRVFKSSPSAPPAPDYTGAANATAAGNLAAAQAAAEANRINQVTPYGNLTYTRKPGSTGENGWTQTTSLSPTQQALLDAQNQTSLGVSGLEGQGLGYLKNALDNPVNSSSLPSAPINAGQTAQDAIMAREQPSINQSDQALTTQLANQGIVPGSVAYTNAERTQGQQDNDLRSQAALAGINAGEQAQNQQFQLKTAEQNQPLNMLNSLRTGAQVTNPSFGGFAQQATTGGADLTGALNSQNNYNMGLYNSGVASANAANASTESAAGSMAGMLFMY